MLCKNEYFRKTNSFFNVELSLKNSIFKITKFAATWFSLDSVAMLQSDDTVALKEQHT